MSKLKAKIDKVIAEYLGIEISSIIVNLKEVASNPELVESIIMAYIADNVICYDLVSLQRYNNGMRIKVPKFQSYPIIEERLNKRQYQRYYVLGNGKLTPIKISKVSHFKLKLPFEVCNDLRYSTTIVEIEDSLYLRDKPIYFNR